MTRNRWAIGIDPGLTETGLVLSQENSRGDLQPVAWATFKSPPGDEDLPRVVALAGTIVNQLLDWVAWKEIKEVDIGIEYPILKRNPAGFFKQVRLYQEIESGLFHMLAGQVDECWITEVNPVTSKALAGVGRGEKPTEVSPFAHFDPGHKTDKANQDTREALADAWAHSLATWRVGKSCTRLAFHSLRASEVRHVCAGPNGGTAPIPGSVRWINDER